MYLAATAQMYLAATAQMYLASLESQILPLFIKTFIECNLNVVILPIEAVWGREQQKNVHSSYARCGRGAIKTVTKNKAEKARVYCSM